MVKHLRPNQWCYRQPSMTRAFGCVVILAASVAEAQQSSNGSPRALANIEVEFADPFTEVSTLRELADGRVLVGDSREKSVKLVDLRSGRALPVGRAGQGPEEYGSVGSLLAASGDTTWLVDGANGRLLVIGPHGRIMRTISLQGRAAVQSEPPPAFATGAPPRLLLIPEFRDSSGRLYDTEVASRPPPSSTTGRSTWILRIRRWHGLDGPPVIVDSIRVEQTHGSSGRIQFRSPTPFGAHDAWTVTQDGSVIIARAAAYRVDRIAPSGQKRAGDEISHEPLPVTEADKRAHHTRRRSTGRINALVPSGDRSRAIPAASWPKYKPAFTGELLAAPDGTVWVPLTQATSDDPVIYDVIDTAGRRVERVVLPPDTRLVGFGRRSIYTVRIDDDDLQLLQRRPY